MDDTSAAESLEDRHQARYGGGLERTLRHQLIRDLAERAATVGLDEGQEVAIDEQQLALPVAVGESSESLGPQGHRLVEAKVVGSLHWRRAWGLLSRRRTSRRS